MKMVPQHITILFVWLTFHLISAQIPDGSHVQVFIGKTANDTTSFYSWNENYLNQHEIPVYVLLVNSTTGIVLPIDTPPLMTDVNCDRSLDETGYSNAKFTETSITDNGAVGFSDPYPGRAVNIRCFDVGTGLKTLSLSDPVLFEIRPAGTVFIYQSSVSVVNSGTFPVELNEVVEEYPVTVTCSHTPGAPLGLNFTEKIILVGEKRAEVQYQLHSGKGSVIVACKAQSDTTTDQQFISATSQGSGAIFSLAEGSVVLLPENSELHSTQMELTLVLDSLPTDDVIFSCCVLMADDSDHARQLAANPICPTRPTVTESPTFATVINLAAVRDVVTESPTFQTVINFTAVTDVAMITDYTEATISDIAIVTDYTGPFGETTTAVPITGSTEAPITDQWQIISPSNGEVIFKRSDSVLHKIIVINRTADVAAPTNEIFLVSCLAPEQRNSPKYINVSDTVVVTSYLSQLRSINWTAATDQENLDQETVVINPAFVEVAPCPCDLYEDACDINCCCDQECTEDDISMFSCYPGLYGGNSSAPPDYMCQASYYPQPDWFYVMCVQWNNSAFLGDFIYPVGLLRDSTSYKAKADQYREYTFWEQGDQFPAENENSYQDGSSVRTALPLYLLDSYNLTLPKPILGGQCVLSSPVRFPRSSSDQCTWTMEQSLCSTYSPLSALVYAQAEQWVEAMGPLVLTLSGGSTFTPTNVNYMCANTTSYVRSTETYQDVVVPGQSYLFNYQLPDEADCQFMACEFEDCQSGAYVCVNQTVSGLDPIPGPGRCDFDDGFTKPPASVYDPITDTCNNAVLSVLYNFTWNGVKIISFDATIILGDIAMTIDAEDTVLTQQFDVLFYHTMEDLVVNYTEIGDNGYERLDRTDQYKRSGKPGYEVGLPVLSGVVPKVANDTLPTAEFTYVDTNATNRLSLWSPGVDGLCYNAGQRDVDFGVDSLGSCMLKLSFLDLLDCANLRRLVLNRQDSLMLSTRISVGGDPNSTLDTDWALIFRQNIQDILNMTNVAMTTEIPVTTAVPITVPSNETVTELLDRVSGRCRDIPIGIHIDIMRATVGQRDAVPMRQIVGAKISYTLSTWQLHCVGTDGLACSTNATWVQEMTNGGGMTQPFQLSSSVRFIDVPAMAPKPKTLYQELNEPRVWKCKQDSCWEEMFYPFLSINPGDDIQYTTSLGLICLILLFGVFLISRPVSRWDHLHGQL